MPKKTKLIKKTVAAKKIVKAVTTKKAVKAAAAKKTVKAVKETDSVDTEEKSSSEETLESSGLSELLDKGKDQGFLTYEDINSMLPEDISDPDQVEETIQMLMDQNDEVIEKWWQERGINNIGNDTDPYEETAPENCIKYLKGLVLKKNLKSA